MPVRRSLALIAGLVAALWSLSSTSAFAQSSLAFGPNGFTINAPCAASATIDDTPSLHGCVERGEATPIDIRVVVRAAPPLTYRLRSLVCTAFNVCQGTAATLSSAEAPPPGSSPRAITRYTFLLTRPLLSGAASVCARQDSAIPVANTDAALLGCLPFDFRTDRSGLMQVAVRKEGVVVDGWIIDPTSAGPVVVEVKRGTTIVSTTANLSDNRVQGRWPGFDTQHGFRIVLPFVGTGGTYQVCLFAPPGGALPIGCLKYDEMAGVFLDASKFTVGDVVRFSAEMLDPGAKIHINLYTPVRAFLASWPGGLPDLTADGSGHVSGTIETGNIPPGMYRIAVLCETGCSKLDMFPFPVPPGYQTVCCQLNPGSVTNTSLTFLGPWFQLRPRRNVSLDVQWSAARKDLTINARDLPPNTELEALIIGGSNYVQFPFPEAKRAFLYNGVGQYQLGLLKTDRGGSVKVRLPPPAMPAGLYMLWIVRDGRAVLASTEFSVP